MSKRIKSARKAYEKADLEEAKKAHTAETIKRDTEEHTERHKTDQGKYIGDMVYGANDGTLTTFAIVSGVVGASLPTSVILILGLANILADGLSMGVGSYLSTKSEQDFFKKEREREAWEIENVPEGEIEELREIYRRRGFTGSILEKVVEKLTSNKKVWVDTMMVEELGLIEDTKNPFKSSLATFVAFFFAGLVPLMTYLLSAVFRLTASNLFAIAVILTGVALFGFGSARSLVIRRKWYVAGLETLIIGGLTAIVSYSVGLVLGGLV